MEKNKIQDDNKNNVEHLNPIIQWFMDLIHKNPEKHSDLNFYLQKLDISKTALTQLTYKTSGCGPYGIIKEVLASEIANKLVNTEIKIKDLADIFGFKTTGNFTRFMRVNTGLSPSKFRALNCNISV